ncbi:MAG: type II toxin-antitoxin system VapC family toxin [Pseudomonadales bacterium]|nr:type II toxin-antitoxin system VapC family toxin [Pseudomonadales bacterium]
MGYKTPNQSEHYTNAIVLDNSVIMRWLFNDGSKTDQHYAKNALKALQNQQLLALAPPIWIYESAFVTSYYVKKKIINSAAANQQLNMLFGLINIIHMQQTPADLLEVSLTHNISSYDAAYLLLAQAQQCPLATLDKKMKQAHLNNDGLIFSA